MTTRLRWWIVRSATDRSQVRHVLLISIDTIRADHLGCYGFPRNTTPNIDALAELV